MKTQLATLFAASMLMIAPVAAQHAHGPVHQTPRQNAPVGHGGPHGSHGQHGQHGQHGPHGQHGQQGPHGPNGQHGQHGQHGPHGQHGQHGPHGQPGHGATNMQGMSPAARAFADANARMHRDMSIRFSGNADVDFARGMIPHHQGAIDMSRIVLRHGSDASVKKLANEIIAAQRKEIAQMRAWLEKNASLPAGPDAAAITKAFTEANAKMHTGMAMTFTGQADIDFMRGMIPHHEGAVDMAKVLLQFGKDPELRKLADDVIRTQNEEITLMQDWLSKNGG